MTVITTASPDPQTCARCCSLGLPENNIAPQEPHFLLCHEDKVLACCKDCYARLYEEAVEE